MSPLRFPCGPIRDRGGRRRRRARVHVRGGGKVVLLLEYGGDLVDRQDSLGRTALMIAVMNGFGTVCDVLLRGGADLRLTDKEGNTAMAWAIAADRASVIEVLTSHGATA